MVNLATKHNDPASLDLQGIAQPESVINAIKFMYNWVPGILCGIVFVLLIVLYDLEKKLPEMEKNAK
jgi:glycoside/pentoside/hexuronide:cation symporter, GPH family